MDVIRVSYLFFLSLAVHEAWGIVGGSMWGLALIALMAIALVIAVAGMRMDRLWTNRGFWGVFAFLLAGWALWLYRVWHPSDTSGPALLIVIAAAGAMTFLGLSWPIGKHAVGLARAVRKKN